MTVPSLHDRVRPRLDALGQGALEPALEARHPGAGSWPRVYARLSPDRSPWAVLAFASPDRTLVVRADLHEEAAEPGEPPIDAVAAGSLGRAVLTWATDDVALPGLTAVLAALADPVVVRYRPGRRCTVAGRTTDGGRFVKVAGDAERLHRDAVGLWATAAAGELGFAVARPHGWDRATGAFWQGTVAGTPAYPGLLAADAPGLVRRMGVALGQLAGSTANPETRTLPEDQARRSRRTAAGVVARVPGLSSRLDDLLTILDAWHARLPQRALVPVHGAPHAEQWLRTPDGGLGLVDFDRCGWGDPELDAATLLAELDGECGLGAPVAALRTALLAGYREAGVGLEEDRLALYLAHKRLARVRRLAWSTKPDGDLRAAGQLSRVEADVREGVRRGLVG